jgi:cytochrome P450
VGFGRGEHVCLGAHLARLEIRSLLDELRTRLRKAELVGPVERVRSSFVGGIKRVPLRWEVAR